MLMSPVQLDLLLERGTRPRGAAGRFEGNYMFNDDIAVEVRSDNGGSPSKDAMKLAMWIEHGKKARRDSDMRFARLGELISPAMAAEMLKYNTRNRPVTQKSIDDFAGLILRKKWMLTGETVTFDWNGAMLDGQHRLYAICKAGIPTRLDLIFGNDPKSFSAIDQGKTRSAADISAVNGFKNTKHRAALALAILQHESKPSTRQDVADAVVKLGTKIDHAILWSIRLKYMTNPTSVSLAYYTIQESGAPIEEINKFFEPFHNVEGLVKEQNFRGAFTILGEVRARLVMALLGLRDSDIYGERKGGRKSSMMNRYNHILSCGSGSVNTHARASVIILAWNAYRSHTRLRSVYWNNNSELPKPR